MIYLVGLDVLDRVSDGEVTLRDTKEVCGPIQEEERKCVCLYV